MAKLPWASRNATSVGKVGGTWRWGDFSGTLKSGLSFFGLDEFEQDIFCWKGGFKPFE